MFENWRKKVTNSANFSHKIALQDCMYANKVLIDLIIAKYATINEPTQVAMINEYAPQIIHPVTYFEGGAYNKIYFGWNANQNQFEMTSTKSPNYFHIGNIYTYKTGIQDSRHKLEEKMFNKLLLFNELLAIHRLFIQWQLTDKGDIVVTISKLN